MALSRRSFLKGAAGLFVAAAIPIPLEAEEPRKFFQLDNTMLSPRRIRLEKYGRVIEFDYENLYDNFYPGRLGPMPYGEMPGYGMRDYKTYHIEPGFNGDGDLVEYSLVSDSAVLEGDDDIIAISSFQKDPRDYFWDPNTLKHQEFPAKRYKQLPKPGLDSAWAKGTNERIQQILTEYQGAVSKHIVEQANLAESKGEDLWSSHSLGPLGSESGSLMQPDKPSLWGKREKK